MKKRLLAILISASMIVTLFPNAAFADETDGAAKTETVDIMEDDVIDLADGSEKETFAAGDVGLINDFESEDEEVFEDGPAAEPEKNSKEEPAAEPENKLKEEPAAEEGSTDKAAENAEDGFVEEDASDKETDPAKDTGDEEINVSTEDKQELPAADMSAEDAQNAADISVGDTKTAVIDEERGMAYFRFVPEKTGIYIFTSVSDNDTYGYLYDADYNELASNDDDGEGSNFRLAEVLSAGVTYYYSARYYSPGTGSFDVTLTRDNTFGARAYNDESKITVAPEDTAVLQVEVFTDDETGISYQWQKYVDYIYNEETEEEVWIEAYQDIPGATESVYREENVKQYGDYRCIVTSQDGRKETVDFRVSVTNQFNAEAEKKEVFVEYGSNAELKVIATATKTDKIKYQWYDGNDEEIEGETEESLVVKNVTGASQYYCYVDDGYGSSRYVHFTVSVDNGFTIAPEGEWNGSEYEVYIAPGQDATLKVNASSDTNQFTYAWYDENDELLADTATYELKNVTYWTGLYCDVKDEYEMTKTVSFVVIPSNRFVAWVSYNEEDDWYDQYANIEAEPGKDTVLTAYATAVDESKMTYTWWGYNDNDGEYVEIENGNSNTFTIKDYSTYRSYRCIVNDGYDSETSLYFNVSVDNQFRAWASSGYYEDEDEPWYSSDAYLSGKPGEALVLTAYADGIDKSKLTYTWYINDNNTGDYRVIEGENKETYTIASLDKKGDYRCIVKDGYGGEEYLYYHVSVENEFSVYNDGSGTIIAGAGETVILSARVEAENESTLTYAWSKDVYNEEAGYYKEQAIEGATGTSLQVTVTQTERYYFHVKDRYGNNQQLDYQIICPENVSLGTTQTEFTRSQTLKYFRFVPKSTDEYVFNTECKLGLDIEILDSGLNWIGYGGNKVSRVLNAGQTYFFAVSPDYYEDEDLPAAAAITLSVGNNFQMQAEKRHVYTAPEGDADLKVLVSGKDLEGVQYQWYEYGEVYDEEDGYQYYDWKPIEGANAAVYTVKNVTGYKEYRCTATDRFKTAVTGLFTVDIDNQFRAWTQYWEEDDWYSDTWSYEGKVGEEVVLNAYADALNTGKFTYTWYVWDEKTGEWRDLEADSKSSYTVSNLNRKTEYGCMVQDGFGSFTRLYYTVTVYNPFVVWVSFPKEFKAKKGEILDLEVSVEAEDESKLTYTWKEYSYDARTGDNWKTLEGQTGKTLKVTVNGSTQYRFEAEDPYGNSQGLTFRVTCYEDLAIGETKADMTADQTRRYFRFVPETTDEYVFSTESVRDMELVLYEGTEDIQYGYNRLRCTLTAGDTYYLSVEPEWYEYEDLPLAVTIKAAAGNNFWAYAKDGKDDLRVAPKGSAVLEVEVSGKDLTGVSYQWYDDDTGDAIIGATESTYSVTNVTKYKEYYCRVKDNYGNSQNVWFDVAVDNQFRAWPQGAVIAEDEDNYPNKVIVPADANSDVTLKVLTTALDEEGITFQWYQRDIRYNEEDDEYYTIWMFFNGANTDSYVLKAVSSSAQYRCYVRDKYGNGRFVFFDVNVNKFDVSVDDEQYEGRRYAYYTIRPDETKTLAVKVSATDVSGIKYRWTCNEEPVEPAVTGPALELSKVEKSANYSCIVSDNYGNEAAVNFYVTFDNEFWAYPKDGEDEITIAKNTSAELSVTATACDTGRFTYSWFKVVDPDEWKLEEVKDSSGQPVQGSTLTTGALNTKTEYRCIVNDGYGSSRVVDFEVRIANELKISIPGKEGNRASYLVKPGEKPELQVVAESEDNSKVTYKWSRFIYAYSEKLGGYYWHSRPMSDTTSAVTVTTDDFIGDYQYYRVIVNDGYGNTKSAEFHIYTAAPQEIKENIPVTVNGGEASWFAFTPQTAGLYALEEQRGSRDVNVEIFDQDADHVGSWNYRLYTDSKVIANDSRSTYYPFEAGRTYYYRLSGFTDSVVVNLYRTNNIADFEAALSSTVILLGEPWPTVTVKGLTEDEDYEVRYQYEGRETTTGGYRTSSYTALVRGIGKYDGAVKLPFKVLMPVTPGDGQASPSDGTASPGDGKEYNRFNVDVLRIEVEDQVFSGKALTPEPLVTLDARVLVRGTDYEVDYKNNVGAGTAYVTVIGKGRFVGEKDVPFIISPLEVNPTITITGTPFTYNGSEQKPTFTVADGDRIFTPSDFTVVFTPSVSKDAGAYDITVTMKGNYSGSATVRYNINKAAQDAKSDALVSLKVGESKTIQVTGAQGKVKFASADSSVAAVDANGKVTGEKAGETIVTVTAEGTANYEEKTWTVTIKVTEEDKSITVEPTEMTISVGESQTIKVTGAVGTVNFASGDKTVATVASGGKVTGKKVGSTTVTVTASATKNGKVQSVTVKVKVVPGATSSLTATTQAKGIKLAWKKVTGAKGYKVYRDDKLITTIKKGKTVTYTDKKATKNGKEYVYKVVAYSSEGDSTKSKSVTTYFVSPTSAPTAKSSKAKQLTVKWGKNDKASGYEVEVSLKKDFTSAKKASASKASKVSVTVKKLTSGKSYYVRVRAYKKVGKIKYYSAWSTAKNTAKVK